MPPWRMVVPPPTPLPALLVLLLSLPGGTCSSCSFYQPSPGRCHESTPGSANYVREWSKATVELNCKSWTSKINVKHTVAGRESADTIKTDDDSATPSKASVFGIGVYTDTPGSPSFEGQLDTALDLVGRGGWVTIFLCSWRTHTTSCVNRTTTHDPTSSAMLQAAYDRGLNVVARLGNPYVVRDHADDSTRRSFRQLGAAYARLVASLPAPPATSRPLYVQVGNELNACNEWHCSDAPNVTMSGEEMAKEVAAFARDVAISLIPLRNGSVEPLRWPAGRLQLAHAPIANSDTTPCQCSTQKPLGGWRSGLQFLAQMVQSVPSLYAADKVDWLSSHSYPYSGEPFGTHRATSGLTYYRNETALVGRPALPVIVTETGWRRHVAVGSTATRRVSTAQTEMRLSLSPRQLEMHWDPPRPAPTSANDQANWTTLAYERLWLHDPQVLGVCPFLLAGAFWEADGWPWIVAPRTGCTSCGRQLVFNTTVDLRKKVGST